MRYFGRIAVLTVLGGGLIVAALPLVAHAVQVSRLQLFNGDGIDQAQSVFAVGTDSVEARFDYADATSTLIDVLVKSRGGIVAYRHQDRYTGSGTATVSINGAAMYSTLAGAISIASREARQNADRAANPDLTAGTREFLLSVQAGLLRVELAVETMSRGAMPDAMVALLSELEGATREAMTLVERSLLLPPEQLARKKELAGQAAQRIGTVVQLATALEGSTLGMSNASIPETGPGEQSAYVVQLVVDGDVAASADLWIHTPPAIYLPLLER